VDSQEYLILNGKRYPIPHPDAVLAAFGWSSRQPVPVATVLVNGLAAGPDLRAPVIANRGRPSGAVPGAKVGQLYTTTGHQYAVALADGVFDLTEVQAALLLADPASAGSPTIPLSTAQYGALHRSPSGLDAMEPLPSNVPELVGSASAVCVTDSRVLVDPVVPDGVAPAGRTGVDRVLVPRGSGALVEAAAAPGAPPGSGTVSLVTDAGLRYPLAGADLLGPLGYGGVTPLRVPAGLVALLPGGPALDPVAAAHGPD
jgi:hypothetical protein